jgi:hypothetical protein
MSVFPLGTQSSLHWFLRMALDSDEELRRAIAASLGASDPSRDSSPHRVQLSPQEDLDAAIALSLQQESEAFPMAQTPERGLSSTSTAPSVRHNQTLASTSAAPELKRVFDSGDDVSEAEERRADREYDAAMAASLTTGERFQDPVFPPSLASLGSGLSTKAVRFQNGFTGESRVRSVPVVWLRPEEMRERWTLRRSARLSGADVGQGSEGDCWLVSAMCVVAESEGLIPRVLRSSGSESFGAVQIRLCLGGLWTVVMVDDRLPCLGEALREPVFARGSQRQLWPGFIEKAVAKVSGSYRALSGGTGGEGLRLLTGASVTRLWVQSNETEEERCLRQAAENASRHIREGWSGMIGSMLARHASGPPFSEDELWGRLLSWSSAGFPMGASCSLNGDRAKSVGLQTDHAYSVLELVSVGSLRLLRLRNPWGRSEFSGRYSPGWGGWSDELRDAAGAYGLEGSGIFLIELSDFVSYFSVIDVARLHRGWTTTRSAQLLAEEHGTRYPAWEVESLSDTETYITLWQASNRLRGGGQPRGLAPGESLNDMIAGGMVRDDGRTVSGSAEGASSSVPASARGMAVDKRRPAPESTELGMAVLVGTKSDESVGEYVGGGMRVVQEAVNWDMLMRRDRTYTIVPLAFGHLSTGQWQEGVMSVHSAHPVHVREVSLSARQFAGVLHQRSVHLGTMTRDGELFMRQVATDSAIVFVVENRSSRFHHFQLTFDAPSGVVSCRHSFVTDDILPPESFQIVQLLTQQAASGYSYSMSITHSVSQRTVEEHSPPVAGFLTSFPLPSS